MTDPDRPPSGLPESTYLRGLPPYPFADLERLRREKEAKGVRMIDLGIGDPRQVTPPFLRDALVGGIPEVSTYPTAAGLAALREAAAAWLARRFGVRVDPAREVIPANGSKEAIFNLPLAALDRAARPAVLLPDPGYPVYALGVNAAGGEAVPLPLLEENRFLPDLDAVPGMIWERASVLWLNYPNNPTGATAPLAYYEKAAEHCRRHGVVLASDESYSEIYFGDPPPSALQTGTENVLVFHTLSKRSGLPGFRTGFMAGDPRLVERLNRIRPGIGVATPQFIQTAAAAAWGEEAHVESVRERFRERRDLAVRRLREAGYRVGDVPATFFVWLPVPSGETSAAFARRALEAGVVVLPGNALGAGGEGYVRLALTVETAVLEEALARLASLSV